MNFQRWFRRLPAPFQRHTVIKFLITVFPSLRRSELHFNGTSKLIVDLTDMWAKQFFRVGMFAPDFFEVVSPLIPHGGVFFDVGANFGWCSFGLFGARPKDQIHFFLFEANPAILGCIKQSMALNSPGDFRLTHGCVLNRDGFSTFEFSTEHTGGSYFSGSSPEGIPNIVLDQFIAEHQISTVDLLKMDIEGSEPLALDGARNSLIDGTIKAIFVEVSSENLQRQGRKPDEVISLLRECGFSLFWCGAHHCELFAPPNQVIKVKSDRGSFVMAPLEAFPENYQTDILALHRNTPLMAELLDRTSPSASSDQGVREVAI